MIISEQNKFVFIKGRKVASTTVEVLLSTICGESCIITPITPIDERFRLFEYGKHAQNYGADDLSVNSYIESLSCSTDKAIRDLVVPKGKYFNHMSLNEVFEVYGNIPSDYRIIGIDRCPYDKIVSLASMTLGFKSYKYNVLPMVSDCRSLKNQIQALFDQGYIRKVKNINLYESEKLDREVEIMNYENLYSEVDKLFSSLGRSMPKKVPHLKKGGGRRCSLRDLFTREQLDEVNDIFLDEFIRFEYPML